ncbi:MAG: cob(I)yrinic acid a,c-diamide adenosyltransferase [Candidatus Gracilibacteria bacterium]|jgi:cob(I)alamin adenosyltransferase
MKISTRQGDKGYSSLFNGKRLKKTDFIFEALGDLDELNCFLGIAKISVLKNSGESEAKILENIQLDIYRILSIVGNEMNVPKNIRDIDLKDVLYLEQQIEKYESSAGDLSAFVKPGENEASTNLHVARAVCRRAERKLFLLNEKSFKISEYILQYINRLSDLLFIMSFRFI